MALSVSACAGSTRRCSSLPAIVLGGQRTANGMGRFDDVLGESDLTAISAYLLGHSWQLYREEQSAAK